MAEYFPQLGVNFTTLIKRLEAATSRLEDLAEVGPDNGNKSKPARDVRGAESTSVLSEQVSIKQPEVVQTPVSLATNEFDSFIETSVGPFVELSQGLNNSELSSQAESLMKAFASQRELIQLASQAAKPAPQAQELQEVLGPISQAVEVITSIKDKNRPSPFFNHLSTVADGMQACFWVAIEPAPAPYIGDMKDGAQFFANRILKDYKNSDKPDANKHVDWVKAFLALIVDLQKYVKQWHTTGLSWNAKGETLIAVLAKNQVSEPAGGSTLPPPPPPPPGPPPMNLGEDAPEKSATAGGDMNSVFASLNRGSEVTAGLKKVDKSLMTHKNPALRASSTVPDITPKKPPTAAKPGSLVRQSSKVQVKAKKPARKELEGTKWIIENYENDRSIILSAEQIELNHSVYIYNCNNSTIQIQGKFNAISIDNCVKTGLVVDTLVSSIELLKCQSFQVQVMDKVPTVIVDSCDSGQIFLGKNGLDCEIMTSKCSSININVPQGEEGEFKEDAVPELVKTVVKDGKLVSSIVEFKD